MSRLQGNVRELGGHTMGATPSSLGEGSMEEAGPSSSNSLLPNRLTPGRWPMHGLFLKKPMQRNTLTTKWSFWRQSSGKIFFVGLFFLESLQTGSHEWTPQEATWPTLFSVAECISSLTSSCHFLWLLICLLLSLKAVCRCVWAGPGCEWAPHQGGPAGVPGGTEIPL